MGSGGFMSRSAYTQRLILSIFMQESCPFQFSWLFKIFISFLFQFSIPICSPISRAGTVRSTAVFDSSCIYPLSLCQGVLQDFKRAPDCKSHQEGQPTHWLLPLANTEIHPKHHFSLLPSPPLQGVLDPHTFLLFHHSRKKKIQILLKEYPFPPM